MTRSPTDEGRGTPWWLVVVLFVVVPVLVAFLISRQAGAQLLRRRAVASSHGWAIEVKSEGQRAWVLHGFHRDLQFEGVQLLREGGGRAWRARMPSRQFPSWFLVTGQAAAWRPDDFGTISTLVTRAQFPRALVPSPPELADFRVYGSSEAVSTSVRRVLAGVGHLPGTVAVSLVDDGVVLDALGELPEGEALLPYLDFLASVVLAVSAADGGLDGG